jgi:hypothetical protein
MLWAWPRLFCWLPLLLQHLLQLLCLHHHSAAAAAVAAALVGNQQLLLLRLLYWSADGHLHLCPAACTWPLILALLLCAIHQTHPANHLVERGNVGVRR